jgi:hypothetical protein
MALEDARSEILISYLLAEKNAMKKSAKMLTWPHSLSSEDPSADL